VGRVVKVVAIISLSLGVAGVVGGCIGCSNILRWLRPEAAMPADELLDTLEFTVEAVHRMLVQHLKSEIAAVTDEAQKAKLRCELDRLEQEAGKRQEERRKRDEEPRRLAVRFALGYFIWIAVSLLLAVAGVLTLRSARPNYRLLVVSLAVMPPTALVACLSSGHLFFPTSLDLLLAIERVVGVDWVHPIRVVSGVVSGLAAVVYPPVALVLLWRAKARGGAPP